jgi:2-polyprenyl-6-methoxyphenol hydroxylase-like FAD-dependent oxidoreductase
MLVGHAGYVGICLTDGHCIDIAAAIDPVHIKGQNGITLAVQSVLDECNLACSLASESLLWNTTSALTRNSSIAAKDGVFLLGDSVGYVEPFTGEGMSWAMSAAAQLAKLLDQFHGGDTGSMEQYWNAWINTHRSTQQSVARWVAKLARNRFPSKWILGFLDHAPPVRNVLFRKAMQ